MDRLENWKRLGVYLQNHKPESWLYKLYFSEHTTPAMQDAILYELEFRREKKDFLPF